MQWYYSIDGQRLGPVPHAELERLIQAGTITGDALLWRSGMDQWKTLAEVQERDPAMFAVVPPPLPKEPEPSESPEVGAPVARRAPSLHFDETPEAPEVLLYAGFWRRAGAFLIDMILWLFVWEILSGVITVLFFPEMREVQEAVAAAGFMKYKPTPEHMVVMARVYPVTMMIGLLWAVVYDLVFLLRFSATPGKLLFGLRVVQANGEPLGAGRIVARCLARGVAGAPTFCIGLLIAAFDEQKRGLHDFFCNTRVIKKR